MRSRSDSPKYRGICIDSIRQSFKEGQVIKVTRTEREGSREAFKEVTEDWVIEKKYKYFASCIRKVRNGVIRQSFLWTDIQEGIVI